MADLALAAAKTLLDSLENSALDEIRSMRDHKSQLEVLKNIVFTINNVLLDSSNHQELSNQDQYYIERLKDAVYDTDDLFDEVLTLSAINKLDTNRNKVKRIFNIERINKMFDGILSNHSKFHLNINSRQIRYIGSHSYVDAPNVIGRENDTKAVMDMLLNDNVIENVGFMSIVGVGGLGKTTLAQLVFNDARIKQEFPLRSWVCVADQDGVRFDVKSILSKVIIVADPKDSFDESNMEIVIEKFQETLGGEKCLIVLDDLWNEDRFAWEKLRVMFMRLGRGSRVVVTSRSKKTAEVVGDGDGRTYELKHLSKENSWRLFCMAAFGDENETEISPELVNIGKKIVAQQCSGLPFAIKVVGMLLLGQHKTKWEAFLERGHTDDRIIAVLKLSYYNLDPPLRACFAYCACFPKDYEIQKELLIRLWMAQGYLRPVNKTQSMEYVGNEYFLILLQRCFFRDVVKDELGEIKSFKMHNLMHDVALEVKGNEVCVEQSNEKALGDTIRHLCFLGNKSIEMSFSKLKLRSCLQFCHRVFDMDISVADGKYLRTLSLAGVGIESLPDSIGKLRQLRYLDLSGNEDLKALPATVGQLYNLQTLNLQGCTDMTELPKNLGQLVNLRYLNVDECGLSYMPLGMDKLTELRVLSRFIVNKVDARVGHESAGHLKELIALTNLTGSLFVKFKDIPRGSDDGEQGYLSSMEHLDQLYVEFPSEPICDDIQEEIMEKMGPHSNLKKLKLKYYAGSRIPNWGRAHDNWAALLPCIVEISLCDCSRLQHLPQLSALPLLRKFKIICAEDVEYMEETAGITFFPSLEYLEVESLSKLRGWWRSGPEDREQPAFPRLSHLDISGCDRLTTFPPCTSSLETLSIWGCNEALQIRMGSDETGNGGSSSASYSQHHHHHFKLTTVKTTSLGHLSELPLASFTRITKLELWYVDAEPEWISQLSSLTSFKMFHCKSIEKLPESIQNLTSLQQLEIRYCSEELKKRCQEPDGEDWHLIQHIRNIYILTGYKMGR